MQKVKSEKMANGIIGKKIGMTRVFNEEGQAIPVTIIEAGPCPVVQVKIQDKDGYNAVQIGFEERRRDLFALPLLGHFDKAKVEPQRILREIKTDQMEKLKVGQKIKVDMFSAGERVSVTGISKGLGFQGGVKRYKFHGGPKTHGQSDRLRAPGSIGSSSYPSRVFKGQKMAGRMGGERVTIRNLEVVGVDGEKNLLLLKGAVPGKRNSYLIVKKSLA